MTSRLIRGCALIVCCAGSFCMAASAGRQYSVGYFGLSLDGEQSGMIRSVEGGDVYGEVISEPGPGPVPSKRLGAAKLAPLTIETGLGQLSPKLQEAIRNGFGANLARHEVIVSSYDFQRNPRGQQRYSDALITEVTFPACDGAAKEASYLTITFAPENSQPVAGSSADAGQTAKSQQKQWLPANFRLQIDGLDCSKVVKIDAISMTRKTSENAVGADRIANKDAGAPGFSDLVITLSEANADDWKKWHEEFVIKGDNSADKEKTGTLEFLSPNMKDVLGTLHFKGLGIYSLKADVAEANADQVRRVTAKLYVELIEFQPGGAPAQAAQSPTPPQNQPADAGKPQPGATDTQAPTKRELPAGLRRPRLPQ